MSLRPGTPIGPYVVVSELGRGGSGIVFKVRAPDGQLRALKVVGKTDSRSGERHKREERLLESFKLTDGVVPLIDSGDSPYGRYYVMPLVEGGTLRARLQRGPLPAEAVLSLGRSLALALARAHESGVVHRDVKPENVLFAADGTPLLADLGLAKHYRDDVFGASQSVDLSKSGSFRGTAGYMAPEQMHDAKSVGPPADVFALGAVLYEALAGEPAFLANTPVELLRKVQDAERPPLRARCPDAPAALVAAIESFLSHAPADRPKDGRDALRALEGGLRRRRPRAWTVATGLVVLGAAAGAPIALRGALAPPLQAPPPPALAGTLAVDEPVEGAIVVADSVTVRGRVSNASALVVGKQTVPPRADGTFEATVLLDGNETRVVVVATLAGKLEEQARTVHRAPPWLGAAPAAERPPRLPRGLAFGKKPGEYVNAKDGSILVWAPPARFRMGGPDANTDSITGRDQVVHDVALAGFFIGKHEVSVGQFARFAQAVGPGAPTAIEARRTVGVAYGVDDSKRLVFLPAQDRRIDWRHPRDPDEAADPEHPVTLVTPEDAERYCAWAGLVLPSEAQWERAAAWDHRASASRRYPWGDAVPPGPDYVKCLDLDVMSAVGVKVKKVKEEVFADAHGQGVRTAPVTANALGASPVGALNMAGNVAEWCRDGLDDGFYAECAGLGVVTDPLRAPEPGLRRVHRGGHFLALPSEVRTRRRFYQPESYSHPSDVVGFRVCRELDP